MADVVVHHLLLAADIAGVPLPDMVDEEAGNLILVLGVHMCDALYLELFVCTEIVISTVG